MDKMFKRTLLGAAIATVAVAGSANAYQVGVNSDFDVDVYGVAAISIFDVEDASGWALDNESRVGFRAAKEWYPNFEAFLQIESGWVDMSWGDAGATFGARDTFIGLRGDWGQFRAGRMLTPIYDLIDWPHSNGGIGNVFDGDKTVRAFRDRHSDTLRFDSAQVGNFKYALATGRGDNSVKDNYWYGANIHFTPNDIFSFHAGYETETDKEISEKKDSAWEICGVAAGCTDKDGNSISEGVNYATAAVDAVQADTNATLIGFTASLPAGFGLTGAIKLEEVSEKGGSKKEETSFSVRGTYQITEEINVLVAYAANDDYDLDGATQDNTADSNIGVQFNHVHNGFVTYLRMNDTTIDDGDGELSVRLGFEAGF